MTTSARIGIASVIQESNTFSPRQTTMEDFARGILLAGSAAAARQVGDEWGGAARAVASRGHTPVPIARAWAMSGGTLTADAFGALCQLLRDNLNAAGRLDGLYLGLHGALVAEGIPDADGELLRAVRGQLGDDLPIAVSLDLHANVTPLMAANASFLIGYRTYPHIDQAATGMKAAHLLVNRIETGERLQTVLAKAPMLLPAESQSTTAGPLADLRAMADGMTTRGIRDVSLFPVQPWLDVPELGFAVTVTAPAGDAHATHVLREMRQAAWDRRRDFAVILFAPEDAIAIARRTEGLVVLSESADSPTSGATGDSPAMVAALLEHGAGLRAYVTVCDPVAVAACHDAGLNADVCLAVGAGQDDRFHRPARLDGRVTVLGDRPVVLEGGFMHGQPFDMGRHAVVEAATGLAVLLTEHAACTFDLATWRHVGLDPEHADVVVVRSPHLYTHVFAPIARRMLTLDLPGASTPRLAALPLANVTRPLYPLDDL